MSENFTKLVESFYGSTIGNVRSPVWLCGLEWGGGYDSKVPILESELEPYGFEDLQTTSWQDFEANFWAAKSPFCQNTMKILYKLYNCTKPKTEASYDQDLETWEELGIVGVNGLALILNAFPISFEDRSAARKEWGKYKVRTAKDERNPIPLSEWSGQNSFGDYTNFVVEHRSKVYSAERKLRKPKLIICFGKQSLDHFLKLWDIEGKEPDLKFNFDDTFNPDFESKGFPNCVGYWADETLVAVVPFPKIISDERLKNISTWLYNEVSKKYGPNWLDIPNIVISEKTDEVSIQSEVLSETRLFQDLVNQQLACLERLKESAAKLPDSWYSTEDGQKQLESLKETLLHDYFHEFDALRKDLKDQQDQKRKETLEKLR